MKTKYISVAFFTMLMAIFFMPATFAQSNNVREGSTSKLNAIVVDESGQPVANALVAVGEGIALVKTDSNGEFTIVAPKNCMLTISADNLETACLNSNLITQGKKIVLVKKPAGLSEKDLVEMPFRKMYKREIVGAVSTVTEEMIGLSNQTSLINALAGKVAGLNVTVVPSGPLESVSIWNIRGLSRSASGNDPLVIVDGIERNIGDLMPEEVESISVLKDITSKMLYGPKAANGVIIIKTKRGLKFTRDRQISVEYGIQLPTALPEYLSSVDYATMYNQARANDGLSAYYSQKQIEGYTSGTNPMLYPNSDLQDILFNKSMNYRKATAQFRGGNDIVQYYVNASYLGGGGYEVVKNSNLPNRFVLRANLDFKVTDWLSAFVDISGRMDFRNTNYTSANTIFTMASEQRPNEYPVWVSMPETSDLIYYGAGEYAHLSSAKQNVYAEVMSGGLRENTVRKGQTNLGFNLDLNQYLKGLTAKAFVTLDTYNFLSLGKNEDFDSYRPVYSTDSNGNTIISSLERMSVEKQVASLSKLDHDYYRNYGYFGQLSYDNTFAGVHKLQSDLIFFQSKREIYNTPQDDVNLTFGMRTNYAFDNRIVAELDMALMGSSKFAKNHRYGFFPAAGLGWVISEEDFFTKSQTLNYLKLKARTGLIGIDRYVGDYRFEERYSYEGTVYFGPNAADKVTLTNLVNSANPDLTWEKSLEFNFSAEAMLFDNKLSAELSYFNTLRYDIINAISNFSQITGNVNFYRNYEKVGNQGIETDFKFSDQIGELKYSVGANFIWSKAKKIRANEAAGLAENRRAEGKALDTYFGMQTQGLFTSQSEIGSSTFQNLGAVSVGDIQYINNNGDQVIDKNDMVAVGNSYPRLQAGLNINLSYKHFELALSDSGKFGYDIYTSNSYYWMDETDKYSAFVYNYYNPSTGEGKYPALTSKKHSNNFISSDLWMQSGSFFKLRDTMFSYTFTGNKVSKAGLKQVKLFIRGSNLLTITSFKDLDPENINAGITSYPFFRTVTGGINVVF